MKIYAAPEDIIGEGFVWIVKADLPARSIVKITNPSCNRSVFCEALQIEKNFLASYNQNSRLTITCPASSIVMSAWYRARLGGLETQQDYLLEISAANNYWGKLLACMHHPQIVVRVAVWLGVISVALGVAGVFLGVISIWPKA